MTLDTWILYVSTVLVLMSTPGPSHLLMLSVSMSNGFRRSLATAIGDLTANAIQMTLAGLGLAAVLTASQLWFGVVKWLGVTYLAWIGLRLILKSFQQASDPEPTPPAAVRTLWLRGFVTSAANPKAVVFFAALFPQFLDPGRALVPQVLILGMTYLIIDGMFLLSYGRGASWIADKLSQRTRPWIDRASGACLLGTAILLGLKRQTTE
ncbi:MAG: LysE family translocator [Acidobacteriota bacterium]